MQVAKFLKERGVVRPPPPHIDGLVSWIAALGFCQHFARLTEHAATFQLASRQAIARRLERLDLPRVSLICRKDGGIGQPQSPAYLVLVSSVFAVRWPYDAHGQRPDAIDRSPRERHLFTW